MGTFTPIAMKCTQEQFYAIIPKLKGFDIHNISNFNVCNYLLNNLNGNINMISNISESHKMKHNRVVHEEWNEEIFLEACGIEVETLQEKEQRLLKELKEVQQQIEENKPKVGDWCKFWDDDKSKIIVGRLERVADTGNYRHYVVHGVLYKNCEKITDSTLLESLNKLFK